MSEDKNTNISAIGKGLLVSVVLTFIMILAISLLCYFFVISDKFLSMSVFLATGISVLAGGFLALKKIGNKGLLNGGILGILYILLMLFLKLVTEKGFSFDVRLLANIMCIIFSAMLGGILGINLKKD